LKSIKFKENNELPKNNDHECLKIKH